MKKHPGFKAAQASIAAREGVPMKNAGAVYASSSRKASPAAKAANPRLNKVSAARGARAKATSYRSAMGM